MSDYRQGDPDGQSVSVPFSDDEVVRDDELITEDERPSASPEERQTRKERRQARLQGIIQQGKKTAEELEGEKKANAELRERLARLEGVVIANQPRQAPSDGRTELDLELDQIYADQQAAYAAAQAEVKSGSFSESRQKYYEGVARDIETRKTRAHTRAAMAEVEPVREQRQAQQIWVQKYPDVYKNPRAFQYAQGRYAQRAAMGEAITNGVVDEIMSETMTQFKMGARPAPTQSERAKLSGVSSSGSGGTRGDGGITLTPAIRQMAIAAYEGLPEDEAIKRWTNKTGKRLRERKIL